jgi:hypothetical protein
MGQQSHAYREGRGIREERGREREIKEAAETLDYWVRNHTLTEREGG